MRWNLQVPYPQKDQAKALGAQWDAKKRVWYTRNPDTVELFARWRPVKQVYAVNEKVFAVTGKYMPLCSCTTPPWEDCPHTEAAQQTILHETYQIGFTLPTC